MSNPPDIADRVVRQGKSLVRAIEAPSTIDPTGPFERMIAGLLMTAYKRRLKAIVGAAPGWMSEQIPSASEHVGDKRAALWMSEN